MKKFVKSGNTPSHKRKISASYEDIRNRTWDEQIDYLIEQDYDIYTYEGMKDLAIHCINNDSLFLARHILDAIDSDVGDYYHYDFSMGTLETPTSINDEDDIESIIDLYE